MSKNMDFVTVMKCKKKLKNKDNNDYHWEVNVDCPLSSAFSSLRHSAFGSTVFCSFSTLSLDII